MPRPRARDGGPDAAGWRRRVGVLPQERGATGAPPLRLPGLQDGASGTFGEVGRRPRLGEAPTVSGDAVPYVRPSPPHARSRPNPQPPARTAGFNRSSRWRAVGRGWAAGAFWRGVGFVMAGHFGGDSGFRRDDRTVGKVRGRGVAGRRIVRLLPRWAVWAQSWWAEVAGRRPCAAGRDPGFRRDHSLRGDRAAKCGRWPRCLVWPLAPLGSCDVG